MERAQYKLDIDGKVIQAGKFDNKSTNEERDALLRTLLEAGEKDSGGDNEEMDDDELNEVIARNEGELELFRKMDQERDADPVFGVGKRERLFPESELPDIYLQENIPADEEEIAPAGRGARERAQVRYDDGLTEEQWLDAMEDDEDTIEEAAKRKRDRIERRQSNKLKRAGGALDSPPPEESPVPEEVQTPPTLKRKRGRQPKVKETPRREEVEEPKRKRPRGKSSNDSFSQHERSIFQQALEEVYKSVVELQDPEDDHTYSEHFIHLPSKKFYPDYYQYIKSPISFEMIKKRIDKMAYMSLSEFRSDFIVMFANARQYNEPGSGIYTDAERMEVSTISAIHQESPFTNIFLQEEFNARIREAAESNPEVLNLDMQSSNLDDYPGAMSNEGTPMGSAVTPNIRLKIKNPAVSVSQSPDDSD